MSFEQELKQEPTCCECGTDADVRTCRVEDDGGVSYELLCLTCADLWAKEGTWVEEAKDQ